MPELPRLTIPADAFAKADEKAKTVDHYADLSDEERAEEGLPPRETAKEPAKEAAKPDPEKQAETAKPEPEPEKKSEPEGDDEGENEEDVDGTRLFEEIAGLREDIAASLGKPEPAATKKNEDPLLKAALEHDDEVVRGLAERLQKAEQRLEAREIEARESRIAAQTAKDDAEFDAVQSTYLIDGKPMTDEHVERVEKYILKNPDVGRSLSIEQLTRVVFPTATRAPKKPAPAKGPADSPNGDGSPVATIVDQGAGSGGTTGGAFKPRPNETIESAIAEAGKRFGWKR